MTFRVGQKVVCVDATGTYLVCKGNVYTVTGVDTPFIEIDHTEVPSFDDHRGMLASRFRPVVERKTDISIFTRMLKPQGIDA